MVLGAAENRFQVFVQTGDHKGAGTNANIWVKFYDANTNQSEDIKLDNIIKDDFEKGHGDSFPVSLSAIPETFGTVTKMELWRDNFGIDSSWYVNVITVEDSRDKKSYPFPIYRWIQADARYVFGVYDCTLPQLEENVKQRQAELLAKKTVYEYTVIKPGFPVTSKQLPAAEDFTTSYQFDLVAAKLKFFNDTGLVKLIQGPKKRWDSFDDMRSIYKSNIPMPTGAQPLLWNKDIWFGVQRVQGCNPVLIQLCKEMPKTFKADFARLEQLLGCTVELAMQTNKLFIIDLKILENLPCKSDSTVCAPIALFHLDQAGNLMPLAIQLFQKTDDSHPVFYKDDEPNTWAMAKMWYNNADASYHQSCTHLAFTHLIMEGVSVCTQRNLSPSHPMYKLMAPHFLYIMAINNLAVAQLLNPGGWVDTSSSIGIAGLFDLVARRYGSWNLEKDAIPMNDCKDRKVDDPTVLPYYPYRDDATAVFKAIEKYVTTIVNHVYDDDTKLTTDQELQAWAKELVVSREKGGCGIMGVPGEGQFTKKTQVITTISAIISTCSMGHAAANFNQYEEYGFPPNYPFRLIGAPPNSSKKTYSEREILEHFPDLASTLDTTVITRLLSSKGTKSLGDFEHQYLYDPVCVEAAAIFRDDLKTIGTKIKKRNQNPGTQFEYPWLDPEMIPNAISI